MDSCCSTDIVGDGRRRRVLWAVLAINATMFVVELVAGYIAGSVALQADSLDMLGDTLVYGFSLAVVARGDVWKARAAMLKAWIMFAFAALVLAQVAVKLVTQAVPSAPTVGIVGLVALAANLACLALLFRHRADDINMRSTWICSRNDIVANTSVIVSAGLVAVTASIWPDIVVSLAIVGLFLRSAIGVAREARESSRSAVTSAVRKAGNGWSKTATNGREEHAATPNRQRTATAPGES